MDFRGLTREADRTAHEAPCPVCRAPRRIWCSPDGKPHTGRRLLRLEELRSAPTFQDILASREVPAALVAKVLI